MAGVRSLSSSKFKESEKNFFDVVVLGAGCAGLSAAIYTSRGGLKTLVVNNSTLTSGLEKTSFVRNYPGFYNDSDNTKLRDGPDILENMRQQAVEAGVNFFSDEINNLTVEQRDKKIILHFELSNNTYSIVTLFFIPATGKGPKLLGVTGEQNLLYSGISTCAICDAPICNNQKIAIVGGGDSATSDLIALAPYAKEIIFFIRRDLMNRDLVKYIDKFKKTGLEITVYENSNITSFDRIEDEFISVKFQVSGKSEVYNVNVFFVFLAIGSDPNVEIYPSEWIENVNGTNYLKKNIAPNIVAVGDVVHGKYNQAILAAADGARVGLDAVEYIVSLDESDKNRRTSSYVNSPAPEVRPKNVTYENMPRRTTQENRPRNSSNIDLEPELPKSSSRKSSNIDLEPEFPKSSSRNSSNIDLEPELSKSSTRRINVDLEPKNTSTSEMRSSRIPLSKGLNLNLKYPSKKSSLNYYRLYGEDPIPTPSTR